MTKHISEFLSTDIQAKAKEPLLSPEATKVVNSLFGFFCAICRGFEKQYQDPQKLNIEKTQWIKAFKDVGILDIRQCELGVRKCRLESPIYTPTIKQFLEWNSPTSEDLGLPSVEDAYKEACENSNPTSSKAWTHQAVKHAWVNTGSWRMSQQARSQSFPVFEKHYKLAIKLFHEGRLLDQLEDQSITRKQDLAEKNKQEVVCEQFKHIKSADEALKTIMTFLKQK